jgi:uncharacterized iron-regulated membrane protein
MSFWRTPRKVLFRRWLFQVHLWTGLIAGLYYSTVCLTGALIVYKIELEQQFVRDQVTLTPAQVKAPRLSWQALCDRLRAAEPTARITTLYFPAEETRAPYFRYVTNRGRFDGRTYAWVEPSTGRILAKDEAPVSWLAWLYDLHAHLLSGKSGLWWNGVGGFTLIVMMLSGVVIWWPGVKLWRSALRYERRAGWKRKNYDLHRLVGLAAALPIILISLTGAYYAFPDAYKYVALKMAPPGEWFSPPAVPLASRDAAHLPLDVQIAIASRALPSGSLTTYQFSAGATAPAVRFSLPGDWCRQGCQKVSLDPHTGSVLRRELTRDLPLPIRLIGYMGPLHFGTFGGHPVRIVWMLMGLAVPGLFVTGALMYWNRYLSKRWRFAAEWRIAERMLDPARENAGSGTASQQG